MISTMTALFIIFAAVIGSTTLMGVLGYLFRRLRRLEAEAGREARSDLLVEQVDGIREELFSVQEEVAALSARLDFTEKLLTRAADTAAPDETGP